MSKSIPLVAGALLFLLAAGARLVLVPSARFTDDEARFYDVARGIAQGESRPLLGPPLTGGEARHPGPAFYYLMAASQKLSPTPEAASALVALLGALSVLLFWLALRREGGEWPALFAALLMACSPWATLYADRIWNSNVIGFLVAAALWAALRLRARPGSAAAVAILLLTCGLMPQFHLSAPIVWLGLGVLVWRNVRRWNRWGLALGVLLVALAYVPFVWHELVTHFGNVRAYLADSAHHGRSSSFFEVPLYAFRMLTLDVSYQTTHGYWGMPSEGKALRALVLGTPDVPFSLWALVPLVVSFFLAGVACRVGLRRESGAFRDFRRALLAAVALDFVLLGLAGKPFYPHYLQPALPFLFFLYVRLAQTRPRWLWPAGLVFCLGGLATTLAVSRNIDARNGLAVQRKAIEAVLADSSREHWPLGTRVGISLGFEGSTLAYEVLARRVYGGKVAFDPGTTHPRYRVELSPGSCPHPVPLGAGVVLCRQ